MVGHETSSEYYDFYTQYHDSVSDSYAEWIGNN